MNVVASIIAVILLITGAWEESPAEEALRHNGGAVLVYDVVSASDDEDFYVYSALDAAETIITSRLDELGYTDAEVEITKSDKLRVLIPGAELSDDLAASLAAPSTLEFKDADGNVVLDASHISWAGANYGSVGTSVQSEHHVVLEFTKEGQERFAEITEKVSKAGEGKNYLRIEVDGKVISAPTVQETIVSDSVTISGDFDGEGADKLASLINGAMTNMRLELVSTKQVEPSVSAK